MKIKKGIVDTLGASGFNMDEIALYLKHRAQILTVINAVTRAGKQKFQDKFNKDPNEAEIFTFGDTMLVALELPDHKNEIKEALKLLFVGIQAFQALSFVDNKALYRGSFSYGSYVTDTDANTVMGDAVTDAANWYEQSNMPIVMATPKTQFFLEALEGKAAGLMLHYLCKYPVPLKNGGNRNSSVINWIQPFLDDALRSNILKFDCNNSEVREHIFEILAEMTIPKGTESKYDNLTKFIIDKTALYHKPEYLKFESESDKNPSQV